MYFNQIEDLLHKVPRWWYKILKNVLPPTLEIFNVKNVNILQQCLGSNLFFGFYINYISIDFRSLKAYNFKTINTKINKNKSLG